MILSTPLGEGRGRYEIRGPAETYLSLVCEKKLEQTRSDVVEGRQSLYVTRTLILLEEAA